MNTLAMLATLTAELKAQLDYQQSLFSRPSVDEQLVRETQALISRLFDAVSGCRLRLLAAAMRSQRERARLTGKAFERLTTRLATAG